MYTKTWILAFLLTFLSISTSLMAQQEPPTEGRLDAFNEKGEALGPCPLEHTDVQINVTGMIARVEVTQTFHNPFENKIEAVYVFPLSQHSAVDDMTMTVGERVIRGVIKPREEARQIYETAKQQGHVAGLLEQQRTNIFTQSVANIEPGKKVIIRIAYSELLDWNDGTYHFDFPMVVGPRYIPGGGSAQQPMTTGTPTPEVPDADKITPPVVPEGKRSGHDISLTMRIDAGFPVKNILSAQHEITTIAPDPAKSTEMVWTVALKNQKEIPNRDFVLTWSTSTPDIDEGVLTHWDSRGGFFTLMLQPPERIKPEWIVPKELIFVIDKSGSMGGFPIETAKATMRRCISNLNPGDRFNLMTFAGGVGFCFDKPVEATPDNIAKAQEYLASLRGSGGTEMMKAINACLKQDAEQREGITPEELVNLPADGRTATLRVPHHRIEAGRSAGMPVRGISLPNGVFLQIEGGPELDDSNERVALLTGQWSIRDGLRIFTVQSYVYEALKQAPGAPIRVVCFMTDGYVGNDMTIIDAVKKNAGTTRVFSFGIGSSVNRYLLDGMARAGRGEVEYVLSEKDAQEASERFYERIHTPVLTDITIDWNGLPVDELYPQVIPDLFGAKPVVVKGRYSAPANGTITIRGRRGNESYVRVVPVQLAGSAAVDETLASLWAREKVEALMNQDLKGIQQGNPNKDIKGWITQLGVEYNLLTQFTSFVAVEDQYITEGGESVRVEVPVEMPQGVSHQGVFGALADGNLMASCSRGSSRRLAPPAPPALKKTPAASSTLYCFNMSSADSYAETEAKKEKLGPLAKFSPDLQQMLQVVKAGKTPGTATFDVKDGEILIQIFLSDLKEETRKALSEAGFTIKHESTKNNILTGRIALHKLEDLAKLESILFVKPVIRQP